MDHGINQVYTGSFWMGAFSGPTAKRHRLWSNDQSLLEQLVQQGEVWYIPSYPKLSHISLPKVLSSSDSSCQCAGGHMTRAALQALPGAAQGLVKKYVDKRGQRRHCGVKDSLRSSQFFDFINDKIETVMCCYKNKSVSKVVYASVCPSHCPIGHSRSPGMGMVQVEIKHVSKNHVHICIIYVYIYICAVWFGDIYIYIYIYTYYIYIYIHSVLHGDWCFVWRCSIVLEILLPNWHCWIMLPGGRVAWCDLAWQFTIKDQGWFIHVLSDDLKVPSCRLHAFFARNFSDLKSQHRICDRKYAALSLQN